MKKDVQFGQNSLRFLYLRYKDSPYYAFGIISVTVIVCLILVVTIVIPQLTSWFSLREEAIQMGEKIAVINRNINYMKNVDRAVLNSQMQVATAAIPPEKDFASILNALTDSSIRSGVSLDDYAFQVGNISSASAKPENVVPNGLPSLKLTVSVTGTVDKVILFLKNLQEKLPLSQVTDIDGTGQSVTINMEFYYKPLSETKYKDDEPITPVGDAQRQLIDSLSVWQRSTTVPPVIIPEGSSSAMPLF